MLSSSVNISQFVPVIVALYCFVGIYDLVVISLVIRFVFNRKAHERAQLHFDRHKGLRGLWSIFWRSLKLEYIDNLNHKAWVSKSLRWHIRLFRYMFYTIVPLAIVAVIALSIYFVQIANTYSVLDAYL